MSLFRSSIDGLVPYEPGKPVEAVQRELGLERVVKLASNEGPFPPFPAALEAMQRAALELNRYPDGGAWALRTELAERHGVAFEELIVGAGADGIIDLLVAGDARPGRRGRLRLAVLPELRPHAAKLGAEARRVPLRDHTYDLDGLLAAIGPRTKLVYVCHPNNPTGTANGRAELARVPRPAAGARPLRPRPGVLRVHRRPGLRRRARRSSARAGGSPCCARSRRSTGSPACASAGRSRRRTSPRRRARCAARSTSPRRRRRPRSRASTTPQEIARRRQLNADGRDRLAEILRSHGLEPAGPARGNFLFADVGGGRALFEQLQREGVIVRPLDGFGAPEAIRVTVGHAGGERVLRGRVGTRPFGRLVTSLHRWYFRAEAREVQLRPAHAAQARRGSGNLFFATLASSVGTLLAAVALAIDVQERTNSGPWVAAVLVVEFLPTVVVGLLLGPLLDRLERRVADGRRRRRPGRGLRGAAVRAERGDGRRASRRRRSRDRLLPAGRLRRGPEPRPRRGAARANALLQGVENVSWAFGPLVGGVLTAAAGPSAAYAINAVVLPRLHRARACGSRRACCRASARSRAATGAISRDGFSAALRSPSMRAVLVAWGIASLATGAANVVEIFLAKHTFSAGDLGYGLLYSAMGVGLVVGSLFERGGARPLRCRAHLRCEPHADGDGLRRGGVEPEHLGCGRLPALLRRRERGSHRLQRAARPARHLRSDARPGAHVRDEHHVSSWSASATESAGCSSTGRARAGSGQPAAWGCWWPRSPAGCSPATSSGEAPAEDEVRPEARRPVAAAH